jgi:hypothetical protein
VSGLEEGRDAALAAIAMSTGRQTNAAIRFDAASERITIDDRVQSPLVLLRVDETDEPGIWQFDDAPAVPVGTVPRWSGYLVRVEPHGEPSVVRLDVETLPTAWGSIAEWINDPVLLAQLIARYAGRDAGLPVHHSVVRTVDDLRALVASGERDRIDLGVVRPPTLMRDGPPDLLTHLTFLTSFLEASRSASATPNGLGFAQWTAAWGRLRPLDWTANIIARGIPSIYSR